MQRPTQATTSVTLMTLAEAAQFLRLNPRTLEAWARGPNPRVPVIRLGRKVLFDRDDLEKWLRTRTVKPRDVAQR